LVRPTKSLLSQPRENGLTTQCLKDLSEFSAITANSYCQLIERRWRVDRVAQDTLRGDDEHLVGCYQRTSALVRAVPPLFLANSSRSKAEVHSHSCQDLSFVERLGDVIDAAHFETLETGYEISRGG